MRFLLIAGAIALLVVLVGSVVVEAPSRGGVLAGAAIAWAAQVVLFWVLAEWLFPSRPVVVYGVGMLGRFTVLTLTAFVLVPRTGLPPVPTLFSLVTVLFATTLLEPVLLAAGARNDHR